MLGCESLVLDKPFKKWKLRCDAVCAQSLGKKVVLCMCSASNRSSKLVLMTEKEKMRSKRDLQKAVVKKVLRCLEKHDISLFDNEHAFGSIPVIKRGTCFEQLVVEWDLRWVHREGKMRGRDVDGC